MRNKIVKSFLLLGTLLSISASLASCGESSKDVIGVSLPNQSTSLNVGIGNQVAKIFPDYEVKVQSADDNATNQKQQVETFITMGVKMIVLAPVEIKTIEETLVKARNAGIKVVVSGASDISEDSYDAVTVSNEYLVGNDVALLAKHWAEAKFTDSSEFDTLILESTLGADPILRSKGMKSISDPYLKNGDGDYVDASGNKVSEANKISNPCYSELVANSNIYNIQMGTDSDGKTLVSTAILEHPNIKLIMMYGSLFASGGSQYIVDTYPNNLKDYGIFGGGVSGNDGYTF